MVSGREILGLALVVATGTAGCAAKEGGLAAGRGIQLRQPSWASSPAVNVRSNIEAASVPGLAPNPEGNPSTPGFTAGAPAEPSQAVAAEGEKAARTVEGAGLAEGGAAQGSGPPLVKETPPMPLEGSSRPPPFRPVAPGIDLLKGTTGMQRGVPALQGSAPPMPLGEPGAGPELSTASAAMPAGAAGDSPLKPAQGGALFLTK